jgi:hypothetical protein
MTEWWEPLRGDPMNWLLDWDEPSVRYFTLVDIVERPPDAPAVIQAKQAIATSPTGRKIFAKQHPDGWWASPDQIYRPKYKSTVWQLIILAELGVSGQDPRIAQACEFVFQRSMTEEGDFTYDAEKSRVIHHCLPGNIVRFLLRFGYGDDPRTRLAIRRLAETSLEQGWTCRHHRDAPCLWGALKTLWAFSEIPEAERSSQVREAIERGAEFFLSQDFAALGPEWQRFGFPLFYQCDLLFGLRVMTALGYGRDPRLQPAVEIMLAKQDEGGRWIMERSFNGRMQTNIERQGRPSKWITLNALRVLKGVYDYSSQ